MAASNRANIIAKAHKVLKKHFKPVPPVDGRSVMEHLLFACCLENSRHEKAEEGFARIRTIYFDWNEIRVTTARELAESFDGLADPRAAARNLKRTLHSIFETVFKFDLEDLKKQNLGKAIQQLESLGGTTKFTVSYAVQHALGGHAIPLCAASLEVMRIIGAITDSELEKGVVPGLERAVPKNKGAEFASLLHQLGSELAHSMHSPKLRNILLEIASDAKDRFPKKGKPKEAEPEVSPVAAATPPALATPAKKKDSSKDSPKGSPAPTKSIAEKGAAEKTSADKAADKAADKGSPDKGSAEKGATDKGVTEKGAPKPAPVTEKQVAKAPAAPDKSKSAAKPSEKEKDKPAVKPPTSEVGSKAKTPEKRKPATTKPPVAKKGPAPTSGKKSPPARSKKGESEHSSAKGAKSGSKSLARKKPR